MFYAIDVDKMVPDNHPLRPFKKLVDAELVRLGPRFNAAYSNVGRPSIPPEHLIKATLLQALFSISSETRLCEQITYNMLFRWFLDLKPDDKVWDHSTFTKNRERFHEHGLMQAFFDGTVARAIQEEATSDEHFSVDGTLIQSMASLKSFRPRDEDPKDPPDSNGWAEFKGEKRSNKTHQSRTDPEARLYRKSSGQPAVLCHTGHVLMENRNDIIMAVEIGQANGYEERKAAIGMLRHVRKRHRVRPKTLGEDKGYRGKEHTKELHKLGVTQHIAGHKGRRPRGWTASQRCRRAIEKVIGWSKEVAGLKRTKFIGQWKTKLYLLASGAAYNLLRLSNLGVA
jgi:transposase